MFSFLNLFTIPVHGPWLGVIVKSNNNTDVFERHEMVNKKHAFALEQFPDCLASFTLDLTDPWWAGFTLTFLVLPSQHLAPVGVLARP